MRKQLVLATLLAAAPFAAPAQALSYTYVEAGYANLGRDLATYTVGSTVITDPDDSKAGGYFVGGSFAVADSFYLFASYASGDDTIEIDESIPWLGLGPFSFPADVEASQLIGGVGYRYGLSDTTDLLAEVAAVNTEFETDDVFGRTVSLDGTDPRVSVGIRSAVGESVELWAKANYTDSDLYESEFGGTLGLQFKVTQHVGIVGEYEGGDGYSQYMLGVRASF